jgi:MCM AAA-lid domain
MPHNYIFLRKLLMYSRTISPEMTNKDSSAAEYRLNEFWTNARLEGAATNRAYDSIFRIAEAQAKLNLSIEIDDDIATQAMDSMRLMMSQYDKIVQTIKNPRDIAYNAFQNILKQNKAPLSIEELCRIASDENEQVSKYLGDRFKMQGNKKLRTLVDMLLNHSSIKQIQQHPMVIQWLDGSNDLHDLHDPKRDIIDDNYNMQSQIRSPRSPRSQEGDTTESGDKQFKCYYCNEEFSTDLERIKHIDIEHPDKLHHPTPEDFENRLER